MAPDNEIPAIVGDEAEGGPLSVFESGAILTTLVRWRTPMRHPHFNDESERARLSRMRRTSFNGMSCPVARALERVGEWWNILILRDAFAGLTRFEEFQRSLGIAPGTLTRRLKMLVEAGLLERRLYQERPARHAYHLTECGRDFRPVLLMLNAWGTRHFAPEGASVLLADPETGAIVDPVLVDRSTGRPLGADTRVVPGPAADARARRRLQHAPRD